jgi:hypothetical protein
MSSPHYRSRPLLYTPLPFRIPNSRSSYQTSPSPSSPSSYLSFSFPSPSSHSLFPFLPFPTPDSSSPLPRHSLFPPILSPIFPPNLSPNLSPILPPIFPDPQAAITPYQGVTSTKPSWTLQEPPATSSIFPTQTLTRKKRGENVFHASAVLTWCSAVQNYFT